jgi:2,4-dienoyl-CoA reductase-like NADH-dependent reductase (Old Yellow Enzyme family)
LRALWTPLRVGGTTIPNRVMTSAMTLQYGERGRISDRHLAFYRERARGGVGLVFSEQLTATRVSGSPFPEALDAHDDGAIDGFNAIAAALAPYETRFFAQLFAAGAVDVSASGLDGWGPVRGPSPIAAPGGEQPLPLTRGEIATIVEDFARSAAHVRAGGLDGLEVHGSHGWLIGQFLSPYYNRRDDEYGGDAGNRCRLAIELGQAVRAAVGHKFPVGLSLCYDELIGAAGITPEDTLEQLSVLSAAGIYDFFDLSIGSSHSEHHTIAPMDVPEGFALAFAARAKALVGDAAAILVAGRIVDPTMAAFAVADGAADMVAMSRAHLADPYLLAKLRERNRRITRCVGANTCVARALRGEPVACVLNPATGREAAWGEGTLDRVDPARARSVLVVGAGPAGLRFAATAARRGHDVVVHERHAEPGGHLRQWSWLPARGAWARAVDDMVASLEEAGGRLVLGSEPDATALVNEAPDVVAVATGAAWDASGRTPERPDRAAIPGADDGRAVGLDVALERWRRDPTSLGTRVVIVDGVGTFAPFGLAEGLAAGDVDVEVVTPATTLGARAAEQLELPHILPRLRELGVALTLGHHLDEIADRRVVLADVWGGRGRTVAGVDTVVLACARDPRDALYRALVGRVGNVRRVGDALAPRDTAAVIHEAEALARQLESHGRDTDLTFVQ